MSKNVTTRRARALEALLTPATAAGRPVTKVAGPAAAPATPEPAPAAADRGEPAGSDADQRKTAGPDAEKTGSAAARAAGRKETVAVDDAREAMMVARIGALLGHPGTWQAPATSATLPEVLLAELRAPVLAPESGADADPRPEPTAAPQSGGISPAAGPPAAARRRWRWRWRWPELRWTPPRLALGVAGGLAALLLAVVIFGGDLLGDRIGPERQVAVIQLVGTSAAPQAHAEMRAIERDAGWRLVVDIDGLAPAPPDEYYQGWAVRAQEMVPLGTFHMHKQGQVELWSGVPLKTFSRIEVTAQRVGAGQAPGVLVMVGEM